jgi:hypothetical protein
MDSISPKLKLARLRPVPASERPLLAKRLNAYTKSFRNKD